MKFPTIVYRTPGAHQCPGGTYDYLGVKDEAELNDAVKAGWFKTLPDAIAKKHGASPTKEAGVETLGEPAVDTQPPTRKELETQANKLGIKVKGLTDEELAKKISDAMGA